MTVIELIGGILVVALLILVLANTIFTITQQTVGVVERLGKFNRLAGPGINFKIPGLEQVAGLVNLRLRQLDVMVETKTNDNVFVNLNVSVQYATLQDKVYEAYYKLTDHQAQIKSFVFDVVRAKVPKITLDEVFEKKEEIAQSVEAELKEIMEQFGYTILKALVTDINPDEKVKQAMNEINAATRLRDAAAQKGEAEKIIRIKQAEGEAESMRLQGEGLANARKAIIGGMGNSVDEFKKIAPEVSAKDIMTLVLMSQYCDTLKEIGAKSGTNSVFLSSSPAAISDLETQIRNGLLSANAIAK
jgi:regulator of protease activity HflC (stomatin/prohibitin superfamily)